MSGNVQLGYGPRLIGSPTGMLRRVALVRPSAAIERALPLPSEPSAIYARALEQHDNLRKLLLSFGVEIIEIAGSALDPLESAVAQSALCLEDGVAIMRPSVMERRAAVDRTRAAFARAEIPIAGHIAAPAFFSGDDVMLLGARAYIGVGALSNELGRRGMTSLLTAHGYHCTQVAIAPKSFSLRSVIAPIAPDTVAFVDDAVDAAAFADLHRIVLPRGEERAAGLMLLNERHALVDLRYRESLRILSRAGVSIEAFDCYEFTKVGMTPASLVLAVARS